MPKLPTLLTDEMIISTRNKILAKGKAPKKIVRLFDGNGLVLRITFHTAPRWYLRYKVAGINYEITLGRYPYLSIEEARKKAATIPRIPLPRKETPLINNNIPYNNTTMTKFITFYLNETQALVSVDDIASIQLRPLHNNIYIINVYNKSKDNIASGRYPNQTAAEEAFNEMIEALRSELQWDIVKLGGKLHMSPESVELIKAHEAENIIENSATVDLSEVPPIQMPIYDMPDIPDREHVRELLAQPWYNINTTNYRVVALLMGCEVKTIRDILLLSLDEVNKIRGVGKDTIMCLHQALKALHPAFSPLRLTKKQAEQYVAYLTAAKAA